MKEKVNIIVQVTLVGLVQKCIVSDVNFWGRIIV